MICLLSSTWKHRRVIPSHIRFQNGESSTVPVCCPQNPAQCLPETIFTLRLSVAEKEKILHEEFGVQMDDDMKRRLNNMRNWSREFFEQGVDATQRRIVMRMLSQNLEPEEIAKYVDLTVEEVKEIAEESKATVQ